MYIFQYDYTVKVNITNLFVYAIIKKFQNLDNLDMLRLNDGIYFSDNIIQCFLLRIKYQSAKIEFLDS